MPASPPRYSSTYEEAISNALVMTSSHTVVPDDTLIARLREMTHNDRLFFYFHEDNRVWVLAAWVYTPEETPASPVCIELEVFTRCPWRDSSLNVEILAALCVPVDKAYQDSLKSTKARMKNIRTVRQTALEDRNSMVKHLRKRGDHETARLIDESAIPFASEAQVGSEVWNENKERLLDLAKTGKKIFSDMGGITPKGWL